MARDMTLPAGPPLRLGRYELVKEAAGSAVATTWIARVADGTGEPDRFVQLVRPHRHVVKTPEAADAFVSEVRQGQRLESPNVVRVLDAGTLEGEVFAAWEYLESISLASLFTAAGPEGLPLPVVLRIGLDVLEALSEAHGLTPEPLVHGELTTHHVRVCADGVAKVAGVGIARALAKLGPHGVKNHDRLSYAAPERVKAMASSAGPGGGSGSPLEPRADVFSVGTMLWECLARQRLFASKIEAAVIQKVLTAPVPALSSIARADTPAEVDEAVARALERDPERRFSAADDFILALEGAGPQNIASPEKVAALVARLAGNTLTTRRAELRAALEQPAPASSAPPPADGGPPRPRSFSSPGVTTGGGASPGPTATSVARGPARPPLPAPSRLAPLKVPPPPPTNEAEIPNEDSWDLPAGAIAGPPSSKPEAAAAAPKTPPSGAKPVEPTAADPKAADPKAGDTTQAEHVEPKAAQTKGTQPAAADTKQAEPEAAETKGTERKPAEAKREEPKAAETLQAASEVTGSKAGEAKAPSAKAPSAKAADDKKKAAEKKGSAKKPPEPKPAVAKDGLAPKADAKPAIPRPPGSQPGSARKPDVPPPAPSQPGNAPRKPPPPAPSSPGRMYMPRGASAAVPPPAPSRPGPASAPQAGAPPAPMPSSRRKGAAALDRLQPGSMLGRYQLLMPVAKGGMAYVWAARLEGTRGFQKIVAIKTMLPGLSDDPDFETMFLDEARVASRIRHPNVIQILDLGEQDRVFYIAMEWVDGETLSRIEKAAKATCGIPQPILLRIASQMCAGLHAAHELRDDAGRLVDLVHRDMSPANVLVSTHGFVKIVDFGVAKSEIRAHVTRVGTVKGKTPYLSPEQLLAEPIDRRSDLFTMGAVLYALATGVHPFRGDNDILTGENIITKKPVAPREIAAGLHPDLSALLLRALEKEPAKRFATAADMQRAIDQVASSIGEPVTDEDLASFVRKVVGESTEARAADLRKAIALLDAQPGDADSGDKSRGPARLQTGRESIVELPSDDLVSVRMPTRDSVVELSSDELASVRAPASSVVELSSDELVSVVSELPKPSPAEARAEQLEAETRGAQQDAAKSSAPEPPPNAAGDASSEPRAAEDAEPRETDKAETPERPAVAGARTLLGVGAIDGEGTKSDGAHEAAAPDAVDVSLPPEGGDASEAGGPTKSDAPADSAAPDVRDQAGRTLLGLGVVEDGEPPAAKDAAPAGDEPPAAEVRAKEGEPDAAGDPAPPEAAGDESAARSGEPAAEPAGSRAKPSPQNETARERPSSKPKRARKPGPPEPRGEATATDVAVVADGSDPMHAEEPSSTAIRRRKTLRLTVGAAVVGALVLIGAAALRKGGSAATGPELRTSGSTSSAGATASPAGRQTKEAEPATARERPDRGSADPPSAHAAPEPTAAVAGTAAPAATTEAPAAPVASVAPGAPAAAGGTDSQSPAATAASVPKPSVAAAGPQGGPTRAGPPSPYLPKPAQPAKPAASAPAPAKPKKYNPTGI